MADGGTHPGTNGSGRRPTPPPWERPEPEPPEEQFPPLPTIDPIEKHKLPDIKPEWRRGSDFGGVDVPDREWILPGLIPRRQTTGLYGVGGVNKTDFLLQLALASSRGVPFIGYETNPISVIGLFCEDEEEEILRRANRIARHYGCYDVGEFHDFHFSSLVGVDLPYFMHFNNGTPIPGRILKWADMKIIETGAKLLILDTAPHFFGGNDISRLEVSTFLRKLDGISLKRDCAILFAAHPSESGKKSKRMTSGSTHWEAGVRARLALTRPETEDEEGKPPSDTKDRTLTLWKSNYAPPGKTIDLVWDEGIFTTAALDPEKAKARGPQRNSACEEKFLELLRKIAAEGRYVHDASNSPSRYAPKVFASHPSGKPYSMGEYTRAMARLFGSGKLKVARVRDHNEIVEVTTQGG